MPPSALMLRLRERTRPLHDRLERHPRLRPLLDEALTPEIYAALLEKQYGFYEPLERRLAAGADWRQLSFDFEARRKTPLLRRDLAALGIPSSRHAVLPCCAELPDVSTLPRLLGCLYVLEGATLGGQIIARHLHRALGVDAAKGGAFYGAYGSQTGRRWREFGLFATRMTGPEHADAVVSAACETFEALDRWLST